MSFSSLFFKSVPADPQTGGDALVASAATAPAGVLPQGGYGYTGIASTTPNNLQTIVLPDILGDENWVPLTVSAAMAVPAVMAARNLVSGQISRQPVKAYRNGEELATQPTWLYRTNGALSPLMRMLFTTDDLLFVGFSLWIVERGADGFPVDAARVPLERWTFDNYGQILIDGDTVDASRVILFNGPVPGGLLNVGARTIRAARDLENTRAQRLRSPNAITELHINNDSLTEEEAKALQERWIEARRSPNGAVTVTPSSVDVIDHGTVQTDLFTEAQNSVAVNIAQILGIPSALIDAAVATGNSANLTYQNLENQRSWWLDTGFALWASAISARLSMDDCTPRGTYVDFDLTNLTALPQTGEPVVRED